VAKELRTDYYPFEALARGSLEQKIGWAFNVAADVTEGRLEYRETVDRLRDVEQKLKDLTRAVYGTGDLDKARSLIIPESWRVCPDFGDQDEIREPNPSLDEILIAALRGLEARIAGSIEEAEDDAVKVLEWNGWGKIPFPTRYRQRAYDSVIKTACWTYLKTHGTISEVQNRRNKDGALTGPFSRYLEAVIAPLNTFERSWSATAKRANRIMDTFFPTKTANRWPI
jgi:hypothetical protein